MRLDAYWYSVNPVSLALWPLGWFFLAIVALRRLAYRWGLLASQQVGVPVIVVGNLTVGGTGKTPLVAYLVQVLRHAGYRPGIVSRGYGGRSRHWPREVEPGSDPREVGDEPVLLARRCRCPLVVAPDRVAAARALLDAYPCDVVVSDDGLQHYRLARDVEIAVIGARRLGNGACLPAGPLREPPRRLRSVDFIVANGEEAYGREFRMTLSGERAVNLGDPNLTCSLAGFRDSVVHAVAGIGDPLRFFDFLRSRGVRILEHPFPDHHFFSARELDFGDGLPVLMTEKDAVKCGSLAREGIWYVPVQARVDRRMERELLARLARHAAGGEARVRASSRLE